MGPVSPLLLKSILFVSKFPILQAKTSEKREIFVYAFGAPKNSRIFVRRAENAPTFLHVGGFAPPPSEKISAGAHVLISYTRILQAGEGATQNF